MKQLITMATASWSSVVTNVLRTVRQGVLARSHNAYSPTAQTTSPTDVMLLMLHLGNGNL